MGTEAGLDDLEKKVSCPHQDFNAGSSSTLCGHYINYAIPSPSWLKGLSLPSSWKYKKKNPTASNPGFFRIIYASLRKIETSVEVLY